MLLIAWLTLRAGVRLWPHPHLRDFAPSSAAVYDAHGKLLRLTLAADEQYRLWTPLPRIAPTLRDSVLLYEDRHFYSHFGVNPLALVRAVRSLRGGRRLGGSTVTMQLARRMWRVPSHTMRGKLVQIARAIELELLYGKDELLEAYLNLVPYGGNVEGVGAASLVYFGRPASKLSLDEALALAVIPQSPEARGAALTRGGAAPASLTRARLGLFAAYERLHPDARKERALVEAPLSVRSMHDLPFEAPHLVEDALRSVAPDAAHAIVTTLDLSLQHLVERQLHGYVARRRSVGIENAVAMLVDTRDLGVRALVGSADFHDDRISGQVNGATAKRSPGSALKPFVYGLALDEGVIHPMTMLKDAPLSFAAYSPENFDGRYAGPLSATDALVRSRNIPAVTVASKLVQPSFYEWMKQAGITKLRSESHYGLGLALGVAEVTMEELVGLYASLANEGTWRPVTLSAEGRPAPRRLLSAEASFLVIQMLEQNPRPDALHAAVGEGQAQLPVAWKTGTSWGFRDAWAVGLVGPYVLAVWVGDFEGQGNPAFVGVQAAAPLFFQIVDALVAKEPHLGVLRRQPSGVRKVSLCALSGKLPGPSCPRTRPSWFIPGRSPIESCDVHRSVVIDDRTGQRTCQPYRGPVHSEVYELWPSDLQKLFAQAGLPRRSMPPMEARCPLSDVGGTPPKIASPLRGVTYTLRHDQATIALEAVSDGDAHELFWFVGDELVGKSRRGQPIFWAARPGAFQVRVVDDQGRADERALKVERVD